MLRKDAFWLANQHTDKVYGLQYDRDQSSDQ
jgi:hypothetical protein